MMKVMFSLLIIGIWIFSIIAWCTNTYKFATSDFEAPYKAEIVRGVGIPVAPIGVIVGFIDLGE